MAKRGEQLRISTNFSVNPMGGPPTITPANLFSPSMPTAIPFLHTPMQPFFSQPPIPGAPPRPTHHPNQASIQLAAAGIHPPNYITPVTGHFPRPSLALAQPHPFPGRNRRQLSIGGPPKAVLGGPARKLSPLPPTSAVASLSNTTVSIVPEKKKKHIVNLPKETVHGEHQDSPVTRPDWARSPSPHEFSDEPVIPAQVTTADIYPPDKYRIELPTTIDVYLPGKIAWEAIKRKDIEVKLEKLGVEPGSGSNVPHIHAPHARAASISSPADPALLLFKLNKLHQAQEASSSLASPSTNNGHSLSVSPQPPFLQPYGLSPSPHRMNTTRYAQNQLHGLGQGLGHGHGHTMSLAHPLSYPTSLFSNSPSPFGGSNGVVENEFGVSGPLNRNNPEYVPPPLSAVGAPAWNQIDFVRGFGLDVPLESEKEGEERESVVSDTKELESVPEEESEGDGEGDRTQDMELEDEDHSHSVHHHLPAGFTVEIDDASTTGPDSRLHSRHVSRLSAALSLRSVGGDFFTQVESAQREMEERRGMDGFGGGFEGLDELKAVGQVEEKQSDESDLDDERPVDPVEEWTGSEDELSIGEFSNPSDEERARQQRVERRMRRRKGQVSVRSRSGSGSKSGDAGGGDGSRRRRRRPRVLVDQPRRLPEFPRPPRNTLVFPHAHVLAQHRSRTSSGGDEVAEETEVVETGSEPVPSIRRGSGASDADADADSEAPEDDIISNPSEENLILARRAEFLGVSTESYYPETTESALGSSVNLAQTGLGLGHHHQPQPHHGYQDNHQQQHIVVPRSRVQSFGQYSAHDPALAHSRKGSDLDTGASGYGHYRHESVKKEALNPFAKPFVFGAPMSEGEGDIGPRSGSGLSAPGTTGMGWRPFKGEATPPMPLPTLSLSLSSQSHSRVPSYTHSNTHVHGHGHHARMPSLGKPLSAKAPEFKPGQFTFRLPGAPQMPRASSPYVSPPPAMPMPLVPPAIPDLDEDDAVFGLPAETSSPFRVQGREKRRRRDSGEEMQEGDGMASFKFPLVGMGMEEGGEGDSKRTMGGVSATIRQRHRSGSLDLELEQGMKERLNPSAQPFTFAGFSAVAGKMPWVPKEGEGVQSKREELDEDVDLVKPGMESRKGVEEDAGSEADVDMDEGQEVEIPFPSTSKMKRAPIPLDFKHPHPSGTAPAGLFKALAGNGSGDERTRRGVRSRLGSREVFEHVHNRPSMDDTNVALISGKASRGLLVREREKDGEEEEEEEDDVFTSVRPHIRRRSSLPDALVDRGSLSLSDVSSVAGQDLTSRMELHRLEGVIGQLLDEKLAPIRAELGKRVNSSTAKAEGRVSVSSETEEMMADLISLFRAQLRDLATKSLEDSQMDARGELDLQLIKDVIEDSHRELLTVFERGQTLNGHHHQQQKQNGTSTSSLDIISAIDDSRTRTVHAMVEALSEFSARQDAVTLNAPVRERDLMVEKLANVLSPMLESLQTDPIDYEFLTRELAQAVKPHISQLIDLASDKRETAELIVQRILPLLPVVNNSPSFDTDAITMKLITEVRRAIAPIDAFEIKEQVADLVVERLDSRLAVRDKAFNVDTVTLKVTESVSGLLEPLNSLPVAVEELVSSSRKSAEERQDAIVAAQKDIMASIADVPERVGSQLEQLRVGQDVVIEKLSQRIPTPDPDPNIFLIRDVVESLEKGQKHLGQQNEETLVQSKMLAERLDALPETFTAIATSLRQTLSELITSSDYSKREADELRKLNAEYQTQLTKARSLHGQVRVEKDMLAEKLVESDRDRLRAQVQEEALRAAALSKATEEKSALQVRNAELEDALAKALSRLQAADVAAQADRNTIADLEKTKREVVVEKDSLKMKVAALEVEVTSAHREKDTVSQSLEALQRMYDQLLSQQSNWEALNAASEKINMVYKLLENAEEEEQQELQRQRERSRAVEVENVAIQKRLREAELKLTNADKTASTARQTLTQAQQRSAEWERRAKEYEGELEIVRTRLDQAEQTQGQLEADYDSVKMQIEEHEAGKRLVDDRENKLREHVAALEAKCVRLQNELEKAAKMPASPSPFRPYNGIPSRPDSRASTVFGDSSNRRLSSLASNRSVVASTTQPPSSSQPSVWDSMHAPSNPVNGQNKWNSVSASVQAPPASRYPNHGASTPKPHRTTYNSYQRGAPSPTPSVVSVTPTQGEDGWWA